MRERERGSNAEVLMSARQGGRWVVQGLLVAGGWATAGCGDAEVDPAPASEAPGAPCDLRGDGPGVWGRVVAPSCAAAVPTPTVTLLDALQFEIAEVQGDAAGEFRFDADALPGDGQYVLRVSKGPYSGPDAPMLFTVQGGRSAYQLVKLDAGANP